MVHEEWRETEGVVGRPGGFIGERLLEPVAGRDAEEKGSVFGDHGAHGIDELESKARAVFEASAVLVRALVAHGAQKRVSQVTVGAICIARG